MEDINVNAEDLEKLADTRVPVAEPSPNSQPATPQMSPEEEVGFHKGALNTLAAERNELAKMIGNVEAIMSAHIKRLEELGVKIQ